MNPEQDIFFHFGKVIFGATRAVRQSVFEEHGPARVARGSALRYIAFAAFAFRSVGMERAPGPEGENDCERASHGALNFIASLLDELVEEERTNDFKRALPTLRLMGFPSVFGNRLLGTDSALKPNIFGQRSTFLRTTESTYFRVAYSRPSTPSPEEVSQAITPPFLRGLYEKRFASSNANPYFIARDHILSDLDRLATQSKN